MDITIFTTAAQLGGTVFTVAVFLWYLSRRDSQWSDSLKDNSEANIKLARALQSLSDKINVNSDANAKNTRVIKENMTAVKDNTEAVKTNGNGGGKAELKEIVVGQKTAAVELIKADKTVAKKLTERESK